MAAVQVSDLKDFYQDAASQAVPDMTKQVSEGFPQDGDPVTGQLATLMGAAWVFSTSAMRVSVIKAAGLTVDPKDPLQFLKALQSMKWMTSGSFDGASIKDLTITTAKLADRSVTSIKLAQQLDLAEITLRHKVLAHDTLQAMTPAAGELLIDQDSWALVIGDGTTAGGRPLKLDLDLSTDSTIQGLKKSVSDLSTDLGTLSQKVTTNTESIAGKINISGERGVLKGYETTSTKSGNLTIGIDSEDVTELSTTGAVTLTFTPGSAGQTSTKIVRLTATGTTTLTISGATWANAGSAPTWGTSGKHLTLVAHYIGAAVILNVFDNDQS